MLLAERVVFINRSGTGKDGSATVGQDGVRQLLPMQHVLTDRMAPGHISPLIGYGVMLEEEVVLAVVIHHAVRVIEPVLA